ncbi:MAG: Yip1 family protein [Clostridia bacterium]|nr:YIP1 family protein [Clostridia bacterium]MDH7571982.1 Yip1 family protein [Clostridia bacterium]
MKELLELVFLIFARPRSALRRIREGVPWWWPVVVFCLVQLFTQSVGLATGIGDLSGDLGGASSPLAETVARQAWVLGVPLALTYWFSKAAIWHLLAEFLGGRGSGSALFSCLGFASVPLLVGYGVAGVLGTAGAAFGAGAWFFCLLAGIWVLILEVLALQEVYSLSGSRALAVVAIPLVVLVVLVLIGVALLAPAVPELFGEMH